MVENDYIDGSFALQVACRLDLSTTR